MPKAGYQPSQPSRASAEDKQRAHDRAAVWVAFRRKHLYSQKSLAKDLQCSQRTIASIEAGDEVMHPNLELLRRFRALNLRLEKISDDFVKSDPLATANVADGLFAIAEAIHRLAVVIEGTK